MVEAFHSLTEFRDIKADFGSASYLQRIEDFEGKVRNHFFDLNLGLLESDSEEEVGEVKDEEIGVEDLFSPAHEDRLIEDAVLGLPPAMIVLSDHAEVGEY